MIVEDIILQPSDRTSHERPLKFRSRVGLEMKWILFFILISSFYLT